MPGELPPGAAPPALSPPASAPAALPAGPSPAGYLGGRGPHASAWPPAGGPALAVLELGSIARGVVVADAMAKRAPVRILRTHPISPGKHLVIVCGGVAEVDEALGAGIAAAGASLVDRLFLPQVHDQVPALVATGAAPARPEALESIAIFETYTVCATIVGADAAAKAAGVTLLDMRLGQGLGGKAFFTMTGELGDVEAAVAAAQGVVEAGLVVAVETIAAPHEDLRRDLLW